VSDTGEQLMIDLQRIEDNLYELNEGENMWDYIILLLKHIGDPRQELRDGLIYPTLKAWIVDKQHFNEAELRGILAVLLDEEHLFYRIGSEGDESVFTRSFTTLALALLIQRHRQLPFLEQADYLELKNSLIKYYIEEKDLRGYVTEGGWAHAAAHGADALEDLVQCEESKHEDIQLEVLAAVQAMLHNGRHIFSEEDDERMACIIDAMAVHHLLPRHHLSRWIQELGQCGSKPKTRTQVTDRVNTKNFLRSLYFRWLHHNRGIGCLEVILEAEAKVNTFV